MHGTLKETQHERLVGKVLVDIYVIWSQLLYVQLFIQDSRSGFPADEREVRVEILDLVLLYLTLSLLDHLIQRNVHLDAVDRILDILRYHFVVHEDQELLQIDEIVVQVESIRLEEPPVLEHYSTREFCKRETVFVQLYQRLSGRGGHAHRQVLISQFLQQELS